MIDTGFVYTAGLAVSFVLSLAATYLHVKKPNSKADTVLSIISSLAHQAVAYVEQVTPSLGLENKTQAEKDSTRLNLAMNVVNTGLRALGIKINPALLLVVEAEIEAAVFHSLPTYHSSLPLVGSVSAPVSAGHSVPLE